MARRRQAQARRSDEVIWDFLAFPTFAGFAGGMLVMAFVLLFFPYPVIGLLIALFFASFAGSHILFTGMRQRREQRKRAREEEDELERRMIARRQHDDEAGVSSRRARRRRGRA